MHFMLLSSSLLGMYVSLIFPTQHVTISTWPFTVTLYVNIMFVYSTALSLDGRKYDLGTIPRIFFHSSFALENQNTFEEILPIENIFGLGDKEAGDVVRKHRTPPTDKLLHEKVLSLSLSLCVCVCMRACVCVTTYMHILFHCYVLFTVCMYVTTSHCMYFSTV